MLEAEWVCIKKALNISGCVPHFEKHWSKPVAYINMSIHSIWMELWLGSARAGAKNCLALALTWERSVTREKSIGDWLAYFCPLANEMFQSLTLIVKEYVHKNVQLLASSSVRVAVVFLQDLWQVWMKW